MTFDHPLVGTWRVAVRLADSPATGANLATFTGDGAVIVAFPSPTPAPPRAGHRLEYWTTALGSWRPDGPRGATMTFVSLGVDETGASVGTHVVTAQIAVAADGRAWDGPFQIAVSGPDGNAAGAVDGMVAAQRIAADGS